MSTESAASLPPSASWRAWLRAIFLTGLVVLSALSAVPTFGTASAERLQRPFEQAEIARWHALLRGLGLELSREQLVELYLGFASRMAEAQALVQAPLRWLTELTETRQAWTLFGTPNAFPPAFRLQAWDANGARVLYESGDPERRWQERLLGYRRVRASYNPSRAGPPHTYPGVCRRLSELVFAEQPEVERVRCSIMRRAVPLPGQAAQREPEEQDVIDIARGAG